MLLTVVFQVKGGNWHLSGDNKGDVEGDDINGSRSRDKKPAVK